MRKPVLSLARFFLVLGLSVLPASASQTATFTDTDGDIYSVTLTGPGSFNLLVNDTGGGHGPIDSLTLTGTTAASRLSLKVTAGPTGDGRVQIGSVSGVGSLASITAPQADLTGSGLSLTGGLGALTLGDIGDGVAIDLGTARGLAATRITALTMGACTLHAAGNLGTVRATSIHGAVIKAAAAGSLVVTAGDCTVTVSVTGKIGSVSVTGGDLSGRVTASIIGTIKAAHARGALNGGSIRNATITATKTIALISVAGDVVSSRILAGADLGADGILGGTDANADTFRPAKMGRVIVKGQVSATLLGAGFTLFDGIFGNGNDGVLGGRLSTIAALNLGSLSSDSLIAAGAFPGGVIIAKSRVRLPQLDPRFNTRRIAPSVLPPDPATVAPALTQGTTTNIAGSTAFLYTGRNAIQQGVSPGTIEPARAAVIRGRVLNRGGGPLDGVAVTVVGHSELGQTYTRADGAFDLAANGGGDLDVKFEKDGFAAVQRRVHVRVQDFTMVDDVSMTTADPAMTMVSFGAGTDLQTHQASMQNDASGPRHATLMFAPATTAALVMPDGSSEPMSSLHIRATELTVGADGPAAMPGALPPTSAYTYCVEFSADEADATGATRVQFDKPVSFYLENFLHFEIGIDVPSGFFDRATGEWQAGPSGRIIKILSVTSGAADLDVDGDGNADTGAALTALGITDAERQKLAAQYAAGVSLWRIPIPHFSAWDANWGFGPPPDAQPPKPPTPPKTDKKPDKPDDPPNVYIQDQVLGEKIPIVGTPFTLNYRSDRVRGRTSANRAEIPLSGASMPASLKRIELEVNIAGRSFTQTFPASPNQSVTFEWDGKDAYGRRVQGQQPAQVRIGNVYDGSYVRTERFGYNGNGIPITGDRTRQEITLSSTSAITLGSFDLRQQSIAGWSFDVHHAYDPVGRVLYEGNGNRRSVGSVNGTITTVVGTGIPYTSGFNNDGIPANQARIGTGVAASFNIGPFAIDFGPDGTMYFTATDLHRVFHVTKDGILHVIAGTGTAGSSADGVLARQAQINRPEGLAVAPDGTVFFSEWTNCRIRSITPDGILHTVAGTGVAGFSGDGGPAIQAQLRQVIGLTRAPDGTLFLGDANNHRIRRVGTDGVITTLAGTGGPGSGGDGGPATQAQLTFPYAAALDAQGNIFIADTGNLVLRKIGPDGIISTFAGHAGQAVSNATDPAGDGGPASAAILGGPLGGFAATGPTCIHVTPTGELLLGHCGVARYRLISPDGIIRSVAGAGKFLTDPAAPNGEGGAALQAALGTNINVPFDALYGPDGALYLADSTGKIRRVAPPLPGFTDSEIAIPSEDGTQLYRFSAAGRHLSTLNAFTGAVVYSFGYDGDGQLTKITDAFGNVTAIQRTAGGAPTAIVAPFGQKTACTVDASGSLASVRDPAGGTWSFDSTPGGLITSETDPNAHTTTYTYDTGGRLTKQDTPGASQLDLVRVDVPNGYQVTSRSAIGGDFTYQFVTTTTNDQVSTNTDPSGVTSVAVSGANGVELFTDPAGSTNSVTLGPDPRFGLQAPIAQSETTVTPAGKTLLFQTSRSATLAEPQNPLSLTSFTETVFINGKAYTHTFDATTRVKLITSPVSRQTSIKLAPSGLMPLQVDRGDLATKTFTYDARGRLTATTFGSGANSRTEQTKYNAAGLISSQTDPLQRATSYSYDAAGRLLQQTKPGARILKYGRDDAGRLTSLETPTARLHEFTYTENGDLASYIAPDVGTGDATTTFSYNDAHLLSNVTQPGNVTIDFGYDTSLRMNSRTLVGAAVTFGYDPATGELSTVTGPGGEALSFSYDGTVLLGRTWSGPVSGSVTRTIDNNLHTDSQSVNGGNTVSFVYDDDGFVTTAGALTVTRSPLSPLVTATSIGTVSEAFGYNPFGELKSHTAATGGNTIFDEELIRDNGGRITQQTQTIGGLTSVFVYSYDAAGRLSEVKKDGSVFATYGYDSNGNRTTAAGAAATYDAQDRLTQDGTVTYSFAPNGSLQSRTSGPLVTQFSYDAVGNLTSATLPGGTAIAYIVDGEDRRIGKQVNGTLVQGFLYQDGLRPVAELDGLNNLVSRFVYAGPANVPAYMVKNGNTYRLVTDHLGSVRLVVDTASGAIAQQLDYDAFGMVIFDSAPGFQPFGFAGGLYDRDTGLVRFGARDYDPHTGRWTTKDLRLFGGDESNLYAYASNDPVNNVDARGLAPTSHAVEDELGDLGRFLDAIINPGPYKPPKSLEQGVRDRLDADLKKLREQREKSHCPADQARLQKEALELTKELYGPPEDAIKADFDRLIRAGGDDPKDFKPYTGPVF